MLALVAVEIAVAALVVKQVLAIGTAKSRFGVDFVSVIVGVRESIGRAGWRKVRAGVLRTSRVCRKHSKRPYRVIASWRSM